MTVFLCVLTVLACDGWGGYIGGTSAYALGKAAIHAALILGLATLALVSYLS